MCEKDGVCELFHERTVVDVLKRLGVNWCDSQTTCGWDASRHDVLSTDDTDADIYICIVGYSLNLSS
jgi:hypothetical protein